MSRKTLQSDSNAAIRYAERRRQAEADRRRSRQIQELIRVKEGATFLPHTRRWIDQQIEALRSGAAGGGA